MRYKKERDMWKKIIFWVVIFFVAVYALVMYATAGLTETANEFFIHVKTKHYDDAYEMLSDDFKQSTTKEQLTEFLIKNSLTEYESADWSSRSTENSKGKLEGTITTKSGAVIPLNIDFIKYGEDKWKIYAISKDATGLQVKSSQESKESIVTKDTKVVDRSKPKIPSKEEIITMTKKYTQIFALAINAKSMKDLYDNISNFWKKQTTIPELDKAFDAFFKAGIDFTQLEGMTPILDKEPQRLPNGTLETFGHYPTSPSTVYFNYTYMYENAEWKLIGLNVNVK